MKPHGLIKVTLAAAILIAAAYFYDSISLNKIPPKAVPTYLRVGYVNLHASKVTLADLKKLESYNCDIWLFLEWNGDNFSRYPEFSSSYRKSYEFANKDTYGTLVLTKTYQARVSTSGSGRSERCNYPMQFINLRTKKPLIIYLVHAPPPVPSCEMGTATYLNTFLSSIAIVKKPGSEIIIGDLNTLPIQGSIRNIKARGYSDAGATLNLIPQGTFSFLPWLPKFAKVDYVFHKGRIAPTLLSRFSLSTSDHSGWVADFNFE